jgi:hypothetical protein
MIAADIVSSGVSCVPPPCGRTFDGGISDSATTSYSPSVKRGALLGLRALKSATDPTR